MKKKLSICIISLIIIFAFYVEDFNFNKSYLYQKPDYTINSNIADVDTDCAFLPVRQQQECVQKSHVNFIIGYSRKPNHADVKNDCAYLPVRQQQECVQKSHVNFMLQRVQSNDSVHHSCGRRQLAYKKDERNIRLKKLGDVVQERLHNLQNPPICSSATKLILPPCNYGYGSQIHRLMYALSIALSTNRTLLFDDSTFNYAKGGWNLFHKPLSEKCTMDDVISSTHVSTLKNETMFTRAHNVMLYPMPSHILPFPSKDTIPVTIAQELAVLHTRPHLWWHGQLVGYITRLNTTIEEQLQKRLDMFTKTVLDVGIHIRRRDKSKEAPPQPIDKYLVLVEKYMKLTGVNHEKTKIYITSDEPTIPSEAKQRLPQYDVIKIPSSSRDRYGKEAFYSLISDLYMLQHSNYVVCTMSSNICRLVYEMMQFLSGDADCVGLVDSQYFVSMGFKQYRLAIANYTLTIQLPQDYYNIESVEPDQKKFYIQNLLQNQTSFCKPKLDVAKYPYKVENGAVKVPLIREGQKLNLLKYNNVLPQHYELAVNTEGGYTVCYPSKIVVDYIDTRPYN